MMPEKKVREKFCVFVFIRYFCIVLTANYQFINYKLMKRQSTLFASLFVAVALSAQGWVKPVPAASEMQYDEVYYLYNKDAGAFFTEGNAWGTQASYAAEGLKVKVTKYVAEGEEWDGKSVLINDSSLSKGEWKKVFIDSETASYVDLGSQANYYWGIESKGDNIYRIYGGDLNPDYNPIAYENCYFGINSDESSTIIYPLLEASDPAALVEWQFISTDEYESYQAVYAVYAAAEQLGSLIEEAEGYGLNVDDEKIVYNNTSSSKEELDEAASSVTQKINEYKENNASPDNPQDVTDQFFDSYDFESGAGSWQSSTGAQNNQTSGTSGKLGNNTLFLENWNGTPFSGKLYYQISNLPNGVYQFGLDIALNGGEGYVYANDNQTYSDQKNFTGSPIKVLTMVSDGSLECGLEIINSSTNWCGIDNAQLMYFGNTDASYNFWAKDVVESAPDFNDDEVYVQKSLLMEYNGVVSQLLAMESKDDIVDYMSTYNEVYERMFANYNAYQSYQEVIADVQNAMENEDLNGEAAEELSDYLLSYEDDVLNAGEMSTDEISVEAERVKAMLDKARKESIAVGSEVTSLITNPNFDNKLNGWSYDTTLAQPAWGGLDSNPCVEKWNDNYDMYQDLELPNGVYLLKVQGFYRPTDATAGSFTNYISDPDADPILAYIYANDCVKEIANIGAYHYSENLESNCSTSTYEGETVYIPNGMTSASNAFSRGDYDNEVYGVVTDGTLRIGIRSTEGTATGRWSLWDNFRLFYYGKDATVLTTIIEEAIEEAQAIIAEDAPMYAGDMETLKNVVNDAQTAINSGDGDQLFDAYIELIKVAKVANASAESYASLKGALDELNTAIDTYMESASPQALQKASDLSDEVGEGYDERSLTAEDALAKVTEIQSTITELKLPADPASDDNPTDLTSLINNPTFDDANLTGWEGTAWGRGGTVADGAEHYNKIFDTYQTITGLPVGTYGVGVQAFYRRGTAANDYSIYTSDDPNSADNVVLYAVGDGTEWQTPVCAPSSEILNNAELVAMNVDASTCSTVGSDMYIPNTMLAADAWFNVLDKYHNVVYVNVGEDKTLTLGVKFIAASTLSTDWSLFDNFSLVYYGTNSKYNPTTGIADVVSKPEAQVTGIYNLAGQKISSMTKGNFYIVNGKKVLFK